MLTDHDIIYIAGHDYNLTDCRISTDHIAEQFARFNRILYVESVGLRRPRLNANDLTRIGRKLGRFLGPPRQVKKGFWVMTPLAIPLHDQPAVRFLNRILLVIQVRWASLLLRFRRPILFVFLPHMVGLVGRLGESLSVYYCTDEHAAFPGVEGKSIRKAEEELLRKVALGFATSPEILRNKQCINPNFYYSPHAVDFDNFARVRDRMQTPPDDIRDLPHPMVGYFGAIDLWLDLELLGYLAQRRPAWSFVLIGKQAIDISALSSLPNVHFIGTKPFQELPRYGKAFDVAMIPFLVNELTTSVSPIKLKEYLAMGKPVVSTPLPAVLDYAAAGGYVEVGNGPQDFLESLEKTLRHDCPALVDARQESVRRDTWEMRVNDIGDIIASSFAGKQLGHLTTARSGTDSAKCK